MTKRALCIGINDYPGTDMDLRGCVNDAADWAAVLEAHGFKVQALLDREATKTAMVDAFAALIGGAKAGDSLVITFSGHGTYAPDDDSDEADGFDEALCPHDIAKGRPLLDDEIRELFGARAAGVRIVLISDSCHSGTVTRGAPATEPSAPRVRFLPLAAWLPLERLPRSARGKPAASVKVKGSASPFTRALTSGDLLLSGCQEGSDNFSYDATIAGRANGAFTAYALAALKQRGKDTTYAQWHTAIRQALPSANYPQSPQIVGSKAAQRRKVFA